MTDPPHPTLVHPMQPLSLSQGRIQTFVQEGAPTLNQGVPFQYFNKIFWKTL